MSDPLILNELYILPETRLELGYLIRFLERNPKIVVEIMFSPEAVHIAGRLSAEEAAEHITAQGIPLQRILLSKSIKTKMPVFRILKGPV